MNALVPPFPVNPTLGQRYGDWVWNGVQWICAPTTGIEVLTAVFTQSGPYMPSPGLVTAVVELVGGGGGGGAALGTYNGSAGWLVSGGGGGAGGYSRIALPAALVAGGVSVTIGAGGAGAPAGSAEAVQGSPGGDTTFGALCVGHGGLGGQSANPAYGAGGLGGAPGTGDVAARGNAGHAGQSFLQDASTGASIYGGNGGASFWGASGMGAYVATNAAPGGDGAMGAGGGGAGSGTTTPEAGGDGGDGLCVVTEYCWATATGDDQCMNPAVNVNARVAVQQVPWPGPGPCPPGWGSYEE